MCVLLIEKLAKQRSFFSSYRIDYIVDFYRARYANFLFDILAVYKFLL